MNMSTKTRTSRRQALGLLASGVGGVILAACGGAAPTTITTAVPTTVPASVATGGAASTTVPTVAPTARPAVAATTGGTGTTSSAPTTAAAPQATAAPISVSNVSSVGNVSGVNLTPAATPDANGKIPSPAPGVPDAYLKPPPPFKSVATAPGKGTKVSAFLIAYLSPPTPHDGNKYWQELEKRLGISGLDMTLVPQANYVEKVSATVAGGNLPDLFFLDLSRVPDQNKTIQQGAFTDLTPFLTGDALKEFPNLALFPPQVWKNSAVSKKIWGVPRPRALAGNTLLFRQDWADKLGITRPKNGDDFLNLLTAFTKNDPDGNGKADTYGMTAKPDGTAIFNIDFFAGMFRVPNGWKLNGDGTLVSSIETDEFKALVTYMRKLYEAGIFHPDAATMSSVQAQDAYATGKVGSFWDSTQSAAGVAPGIRGRAKQSNPMANTVGFIPVGADGGKATAPIDTGFFGITAIPAKVGKDRERVKELLRILDYYAAPFGSEERAFLNYGIEGVHHTVKDGERVLTDQGKADIGELNNQTNNVPTYYYPGATEDAILMQNTQRDLLAIGVDDPTRGFYSPTYVTKQAELRQLRIDRLNAIIQGRESLATLDQYVKDWRSRGGDQMRKEFQDALKS